MNGGSNGELQNKNKNGGVLTAKGSRFSRKYSWFLSEATNDEIVSISKELSESMSTQMRVLGITAVISFAVSILGILLTTVMILTISEKTTPYDAILTFVRLASLVLMCLSIIMSFMAISKIIESYSSSALMWKNIRETADDEKVYEQTLSIRKLNKALYICRNNLIYSVLFMSVGVIATVFTYIIKILVFCGYI